jgi:hypothetical protein
MQGDLLATYLACCQWKLSIGVFEETEGGKRPLAAQFS